MQGTVASTRSKAEMRSVVVMSSSSPIVDHVAHLAGGEARPAGERGQIERAQGLRGEPRQVPALHGYSSLRDFSVRESRPYATASSAFIQ